MLGHKLCITQVTKLEAKRPNKPKNSSSEQRKIYSKGQSKEYRQFMLKRAELSDGFQGRLFKSTVRERVQGV